MGMATISLRDHTGAQLSSLCRAVGFSEFDDEPIRLLRDLLGPVGTRPLSQPPAWDSDVADDATPAEFSVAFDEDGSATVRVLIEPVAAQPGLRTNMELSTRLVHSLAERFGFSLDQYHAISELFLPVEPRGRFCFFSIDLHESVHPRVKVYLAHHAADAATVERAAQPTPGIEPGRLAEFCRLIGDGTGLFTRRPLISSYAFVAGDTDRPSGYTLYLPVRDYVPDDAAARARVIDLMARRGLDPTVLDRALNAVARRSLADGVGLIPHVSLRLGRLRPGITVYLCSEAYEIAPPRAAALVS